MMQPSEPHWQLSSIFAGLDSADYLIAKADLKTKLHHLQDFMDTHQINGDYPPTTSPETTQTFEKLLNQLNDLSTDLSTLIAYLNGFISTNAFNETAKAEFSSIQPLTSQHATLNKRATAWLGKLELDSIMKHSSFARDHAYTLQKAQQDANHLMTDSAEAITSILNATGGNAWARLQNDLSSRTTITRQLPEDSTPAPYNLAELKSIQSHPNRERRKAAYQAELELLSQNEVSYAAAMNSIKGQVNNLCHERGWPSALDQALFSNNISQASLNAMQTACTESFHDIRRYLHAKAKHLGLANLAWYDLSAPLKTNTDSHYSWQAAQTFVSQQFRNYSNELADFAEKTFRETWLDVPPRKGKRNGAFCMAIPARYESRIMLNYSHKLDDVFTLAHELGHAYHNEQMYKANRSASQRNTPMTLAETASIFCETIILNAMLKNADPTEKLAILEQDLLGATQLILDIHSRFLFEQTVFNKRQERELSITEFKDIMLNAQNQTYGDALNPEERNPFMWAHKGHYYSAQRSYYNYPYTFGYLFGLGLYAEYERQPEGFQERYNQLLSKTGMADAKTLAQEFGINIEDIQFWRSSLDVVKARVKEFETLINS